MDTAIKTELRTKKASKPLPDAEISAFCGQMALLLRSGVSAEECLSVMLEDSDSPEELELLRGLYEKVELTKDFPSALEETGLFPAYMVRMLRIGEETGTTDNVMASLSAHYEREDAIRRSIRSAVAYPMVMVVMMIAVIVVLLVKVMPIFSRVFNELGSEMTGVSRVLMDIGVGISRYSLALTIIAAVLIGLVFWCGRTEAGGHFAVKIGNKFAFSRKITERAAACRLAGGLALTIHSGLNPERCLELASELVEDKLIKAKLEKCLEKVEQGEDLSHTLREAGIFTGVYARMTGIGGKTGRLDEVMERIAELCRGDIDNRLNRLLAVIEPAIVIGLSVIVGVILMSVMLPLLGIMAGI